MRIRISRKESKETRYWLRLLDTKGVAALDTQRGCLIQESTELMRILSAILKKFDCLVLSFVLCILNLFGIPCFVFRII